MQKVLLVVFEGLASTVIDSQVLVHARTMREHDICDIEVWSFAPTPRLYRESLAKQAHAEQLSASRVRVFPALRPAIPLSVTLNAMMLRFLVWRRGKKFALWHARTDYAAAVCAHADPKRRRGLIWDVRGECVSEFVVRHRNTAPWLRPLVLRRLGQTIAEQRLAGARCTKAIFVSQGMARIKRGLVTAGEVHVIPSVAAETLFYFDAALRERMRRDLGIAPAQRVLVYCGSINIFQRFGDIIDRFLSLHRADPRWHLLVLTPHTDEAMRLLAAAPAGTFQVHGVALERVNDYLNAADTAILLLHGSRRDRVGSPVKFAEYGLAGLPVIMNTVNKDYAALAREARNFRDADADAGGESIVPLSNGERQRVAGFYREHLSRQASIAKYRDLYST